MKQHKRRQLSCLPCRLHKLRCDRKIPCHTCVRYRRTEQCGQHPAPEARPLLARSSLVPLAQRSRDVISRQSSDEADDEDFLLNSSLPKLSAPSTHNAGTIPQANNASSTMRPYGRTAPFMDDHDDPGFQPSQENVEKSLVPIMPIVIPSQATSLLRKLAGQRSPDMFNTQLFWTSQLLDMLPSQNQCDLLVAFYFENIDFIYTTVHQPTFRREYYHFWNLPNDNVDLIWLSLLFTIISLSSLFISSEVATAVGLDIESARQLAHTWHAASRQALYSGGFESKPRLLQLNVFLATQLYWLTTKDGEALNSCLGQAVRNAQALRLDRDAPGMTVLETELRRRAWWELYVCDTFQSLCYGRTPLIQTNADRVPFTANCNDISVTDTSISPRPLEEPTDTSSHIARAEVFKLFHRLFADDGAHIGSWEYVSAIDRELQSLMRRLPWFFRSEEWEKERNTVPVPPSIIWQHHLLHTTIRMQRVRMLRPFLATHPEAYAICTRAAQEIFDSYKMIRCRPSLQRNPKFTIQAYQSYSCAVLLAAFILVERTPPASLRRDIEMVIEDFGGEPNPLPITASAKKILRKMLQMYDKRGQNSVQPESLAPEIAPVFGGETTTRLYLRRCDINYLLNHNSDHWSHGEEFPSDFSNWVNSDVSLDMLSVEQWTRILEEMNFGEDSYSS